jgi:beta-glucanase (GH16 family)
MIRTAFLALVLAIGLGLGGADTTQPPMPQWKLVWSDEFDGPEIDKTKWDFDISNGFYDYDANTWVSGWGNNELQYYTNHADNAFIKDGLLHIRAVKESYNGCGFTSARLKTRKKDGSSLFSKKYGRFEFRAKLPTGQGVWPALWLMPQDDKYGGWAASGEIDLMEARGQEPNKVLGTLHFGSGWPGNTHISKDYLLPNKGTIADFHVYALEWEPGEMRWYVDGTLSQTQDFWWSSSKMDGKKAAKPAKEADLNAWPAPFDQPFYILMNVAVGGKFLGNPNRTTVFPAEMVVDYVRVYDKVGGYGAPKARGEGKLPFAKAK